MIITRLAKTVREVLRCQPIHRVAWFASRVTRFRTTSRSVATGRIDVIAVLADFSGEVATAEAGYFRKLFRAPADPQADLDTNENKLDEADNRSADPKIGASSQFVEQSPCL